MNIRITRRVYDTEYNYYLLVELYVSEVITISDEGNILVVKTRHGFAGAALPIHDVVSITVESSR